ncbi:hypothetical protein NQ318_005782 [Aromia moschata]|uniref:BPL/LPL catalytic domain-containing protein n=1 Tax=Aromia moschata TaxID=1265417 RepID=A0AAV8YS24_9CUCU|nr:hypothetical protein NQ318_005782 [Aromia moschata]
MFFTIFYTYATLLQWWRLGSLKNKLRGTLNSQNALLVCSENIIYDSRKLRSFENLLFRYDDRIGCTIVPRAMLDTYVKHPANVLEVESFGELLAWRATDVFEAILKTDIDKLTKLVHCYSQSDVDINHELKLLRVETVDVEGCATKVKYDRKYSLESALKYSYAPMHWKKFAEGMKEIYSKIRETTNPKIMIENGAAKSDDVRKVPVSEVKPIKKDSKRYEDRNTLEVGSSDYRRHKSSDHKKDKSSDKHKASKTEAKGKDEAKKEEKEKPHHHKKDNKEEDAKKPEKDNAKVVKELPEVKKPKEVAKTKEHHKKETKEDKTKETHHKKDPSKLEKMKTKTDLEQPSDSAQKPDAEKSNEGKTMTKRTTSSEKKLVKSAAICDEVDNDKNRKPLDDKESKNKSKENGELADTNGHVYHSNDALFTKYTGVKPPNILVYADSLVAKDNVKSVLFTMLNKEKYIIYDLPTNPNQMMWDGSTVLVVVCGTVPPNLTFHLLQYLISGGQLLCLCSDLLYSVLHTFTTAEVREHELVRFSYGKWKQVRMMHHIFCYQASPAKKQFSRDSDHSNQSSGNGSSPIAPRTPSAVEIQHNGKEYTIQVQVLGTEEIWQTPSLLLATVKGGEGRAIFSQVHLEINPNQYEDDENKFTALKDSDQARMEILKDILSNHLDIDCTCTEDITYTPAYFLGRHDLKLKLLSECDSIKDNSLQCDQLVVKFCGKDEKAESPSSCFLPVFIHSCPSNFSTVNYFEALETDHIGRLVIYTDVMSSSQVVVGRTLCHGLAVIPRQQTRAIGRSSNSWISPVGSANFSLQLHIAKASPLGKVIPLTQHLVIVAIVHAIKKMTGCQNLNIGIKWPNDLYANGSVKIGGLLATSVIQDELIIANVGCGVNLDNPNPTLSINDIIRTSNADKDTSIKTIGYEVYFAAVFNEIERTLNEVQKGNMDYVFDLYYKYWLHNNSNITVTSKDGERKRVRIVGIDDYGFLKVRTEDGAVITVQPDGNNFDMLRGLVTPKAF